MVAAVKKRTVKNAETRKLKPTPISNMRSKPNMYPHDWKPTLLDSITKRGSGHTPSKSHPEYWNGNIKWVSLQDSHRLDRLYISNTSVTLTPAGISNSSACIHPKGTVVLSRDAGVGKSAITTEDMAVSQHFMAWQCGSALNNLFLYYWLQSKKSEFERIAVGNTIGTIGLPYFRDLTIALPPTKKEQDAIAEVLSDTDAFITALEKFITKKHQIKQGAMQALLTGKKRLPGFREKWKMIHLSEVAEVLKGRGISKSQVSYSGARACVLYGELFTIYRRVITTVLSRTNSAEGVSSVKGDILMPGSTTTTGIDLATASALLKDDIALGGDINIIRKRGNHYNPVFLAYYLSNTKRKEIADITQGITIHHLYGKDLKKILLLLPTLDEQAAIASILSDMDAEITALEEKLHKAKLIKQGMMQELLTGRIRLV